jgi:hypothetical protein
MAHASIDSLQSVALRHNGNFRQMWVIAPSWLICSNDAITLSEQASRSDAMSFNGPATVRVDADWLKWR